MKLVILVLLLLGQAAGAETLPWSEQAAGRLNAVEREAMAHAHLDQPAPDLNQAALWLDSAAESGLGSAMGHLAYLYQQGLGVDPDMERALLWYVRAFEAGELQHSLTLGWLYLRGDGIERDRAQAESWFERGIRAGFHPARIALASVLIADAYGGRDPERALEARDLLEESLQHDPALASYFLARLHLEGVGHVDHDPVVGLYYTRIGAELGHAELQGLLGRMYANGEGLEPDKIEALKWTSLAAAGGDPQGNRLRQALEAHLPPEMVEEGRRRAIAWATREDSSTLDLP